MIIIMTTMTIIIKPNDDDDNNDDDDEDWGSLFCFLLEANCLNNDIELFEII
jgi:hypothetical protein